MARQRGSGKFSDRWYSWWRGDEVHAEFAKQVAYALRAIAYETMVKAKASIVRRPWRQEDNPWGPYTGGQKVTEVIRLTKKGLKRKGNRLIWIQKPTKWSDSKKPGRRIRYYRVSQPGETPTNQTGVLRGSIRYDFRDDGSGRMESFAGAIKMDSSWHWTMTDGLATHALEWGGYTRNHGGKMVWIEARPFMRPAGYEVLKSGLLRRSLENSLGRNLTRRPPLGIGWMRS